MNEVPARPAAQLTGTGLLADDLYLLAHHDVTGRPFLAPRALGAGLAGALLAELVLAGSIGVRTGQILVTDQRPPGDGLERQVLSLLLGERDWHPVRDWLRFLAASAGSDVARRLERSGYLMPAVPRRPLRAGRRVPVDPDCAFAPLVRVRAVLDPARIATTSGTVLTGLAVASGLGARLLPYGPPAGRRHLDEAVRQLSVDLRELIACTQAVVDSVVLSHRG